MPGRYRRKDGTEGLGTIEPLEWSLYINKIHPDEGFSASGTSDRFTVPVKKETVAPGIDVYDGECYVIYNTDRPPYWLPVAVKEAFNAMKDVYKNLSDSASKYLLKIIEAEYAKVPESEMNKPAFWGGP